MTQPTKPRLKGLVLSGGKGTRLRPFTYTGAKQLVPIANKPILFYVIEDLVACGIEEIGIVVGDTAGEVRAAVGDGTRFGARVTYIEQSAPLGIAHAVKISRDFIGNSPFALYLGDNFLRGGSECYVRSFRENSHHCQVHLYPVDDPWAFGIAEIRDGRLVSVIEKPSNPPSNLAVTGLYMFDSHVFEAVDAIQPSARGELEITDTIQYLIDKGLDVRAETLTQQWIDTGKHDDLLAANRAILAGIQRDLYLGECLDSRIEGAVVLQNNASIRNSTVEGPAIIGENTIIENARIGPFTSVYHDCHLSGCNVADSVVLENTRIEAIGTPIRCSLIGRNVELRGDNGRADSCSFVLGDFSKVQFP